jgi:hypothetical protein
MYILIAILFSALLFGCKPSGGEESSQGANAPLDLVESLPIKWPDSKLPLTINVSADFVFNPGDIVGGLNPVEQMQKEWDDGVSGKVLFNYPAVNVASKGSNALTTYRDTEFGVYMSDDWFSNVSSSALAITQFYAYKKSASWGDFYELSHADIIVNNRDFDFSTNAASTTDYDLHTVLLHEFGHLLGLGHQFDYTVAAVMQPYLSIWESHRTLFSNDSQRISDNYSNSNIAPLGSSGFTLGSSVKRSSIPDGTEYHGVVELHANGECRHFKNGKLIKSHF